MNAQNLKMASGAAEWMQTHGFEWWPRNEREHWILYHSQKKSPFTRNSFSFLFLPIPFFVEKYRTKTFLVKFDKEQAFLFIPAILFLYVPFLFVPRLPENVTNRSLKLISFINIIKTYKSHAITIIYLVSIC